MSHLWASRGCVYICKSAEPSTLSRTAVSEEIWCQPHVMSILLVAILKKVKSEHKRGQINFNNMLVSPLYLNCHFNKISNINKYS